ncbi:MAG: T9SS type A sorting domain-containing protein [Ignavibacteria bacterium]|nr:T9SS type A sorting domain-containing protein [Ignavibacteria bacterium]
MRITICVAVALGVVASLLHAQSIHQLPFASQANRIELAVANMGEVPMTSISVVATNIPPWLEFSARQATITNLPARGELPALFSFNVDKSAPVGTSHTLTFLIKSSSGEIWTKEIAVSVSAPMTFELFQNYPNPFNPSTTISYQLPEPARVSLSIFNLLGQLVDRPVESDQNAGYHEVSWNAGRLSSGLYLCELETKTPAAKTHIARKTMLLLK